MRWLGYWLILSLAAASGCLSSPDDAPTGDSERPGKATSFELTEHASSSGVVTASLRGPIPKGMTYYHEVSADWSGHPGWQAQDGPISETNFSDEQDTDHAGLFVMKEREGRYDVLHQVGWLTCHVNTPEDVSLEVAVGPLRESSEYTVGSATGPSGKCGGTRPFLEDLPAPELADDEALHVVSYISNSTGLLTGGNHTMRWKGASSGSVAVHNLSRLDSVVRVTPESRIAAEVPVPSAAGAPLLPGEADVGQQGVYRFRLNQTAAVALRPLHAGVSVSYAEWYYSIPGRGTVVFQGAHGTLFQGTCVSGCEEGLEPDLVIGGPGDWEVGVTRWICVSGFGCEPKVFVIPIPM